MQNNRNISDLTPEMQKLCKAFIEACKKEGVDIIITSTYRDFESQDALYAQGRTTTGSKVTNAKAGYSMHNFRLAFDFLPLTNGKADWNNTALFMKCGKIGESVGLEWGGSWKSFTDLPHMQMPGQSLERLRMKAGL